MKRRQSIKLTSAGLLAVMISPGIWEINNDKSKVKKYQFKPYKDPSASIPINQVTPDNGFYTNTYYDVIPWSPGQKLLAVTKLPYQDKITTLGDIAEACVIDLEEQSIRSVYKTKVWGYQLGANLHWGTNDRYLYTNDIIDGVHAVTVRVDLESNETKAFAGPLYDIAPERNKVIGPTLEYLNTTQYSYSTPAKTADESSFMRLPAGAAENEGLWETDLIKNNKKLLLSLKEAAGSLEEQNYYNGGTFYFFHTKYNAPGNKIMLVMRCTFPDSEEFAGKSRRNPSLLTTDANGNNISTAVSRKQWQLGGHHPTWHPDGEHIIMNLTPEWLGEDKLRFCQFKYDGSEFKILSKKFLGSGHPSITPDSRYLLSDAYPFEDLALGNGKVPVRLIDLKQDVEHTVCHIFTDLGQQYDVRRFWGPSKLDAHPVWDRNFSKICFNGAPEGKRAVFIADLDAMIGN